MLDFAPKSTRALLDSVSCVVDKAPYAMFNRLVALVQCLVDTLGGAIGKGVEIRSKLFAGLVPAIAFGPPELVKA